MKKLFLILSVALFALGTVNAFAQEAAAAAEETAVAAETALAGDSMHHIMMQNSSKAVGNGCSRFFSAW